MKTFIVLAVICLVGICAFAQAEEASQQQSIEAAHAQIYNWLYSIVSSYCPALLGTPLWPALLEKAYAVITPILVSSASSLSSAHLGDFHID
ncbi:MAG TPA: hypothetical protein VMF29_02105 [Candidatus Edwardsbacteria bacterium]|nr:hypothetical protein [Candidatus Edwardsbacteria bacterium]